MLHCSRWLVLLAAAPTCLLVASSSDSVAPEIQDGGKFFSADALKKADERIRDIYRKHGRDVLIETYATVPSADVDKVKGMDAEQRAAYVSQWAKSRFLERVVNGVYVTICKEPQSFHVLVRENDKAGKFNPKTGSTLETAIRKELQAKRFDGVLDQVLQEVEGQLTKK